MGCRFDVYAVMELKHSQVQRSGEFAAVTMNRP